MKKVIIIFATVALLMSCNVYRYPYSSTIVVFDYSEYAQKGFFITESNSVSFEYEPVSSIMAVVESGYEVLESRSGTSEDVVYGSFTTTKYGDYVSASAQMAIDELYKSAINMGADGIINFKIVYTPYSYYNGKVISYESYLASGMAIKRK